MERTPVVFSSPRSLHRALFCLLPVIAAGLGACVDSAARQDSPPAAAVATRAPADTDDFGAPLPVDARDAARVVSLNPAATEIIFALGAQQHLIGRSRWDEFPAEAKAIPALGDGIKPNVEAVLATKPTLVVLYATADNRPAAATFARAGVRTLAVRVDRIAHFHTLVHTLGVALGEDAAAARVSDSVAVTLERVRSTVARLVPLANRPRVVWPVWVTPPMVIGGGSYMDELLAIAGANNVFRDNPAPSPTVSIEEIIARAPQRVVTSETRAAELRSSPVWGSIPAVKNGAFSLDDPKLAGRPSVVMGMAAVQLARALHPALADSIR
jgi:ABC-type Fe3+-hydroxamate transport system substrate-binding protein